MKLSKSQIEKLKQLISHKGYTAIDVQYEILDHVACKIEELMEQDPKLSLESAFAKVHASFGIFGFSGLEESYEKAIQQKATKFTFQSLTELWTSWRILIPIVMTILFLNLAFLNQYFLGHSYLGSYLVSFGVLYLTIMLTIGKNWKQLKVYRNYAGIKQSYFFLIPMFLGLSLIFQFSWRFKPVPFWNISNLSFGEWTLIIVVFSTFSLLLGIRKSIANSVERTQKLQKLYESA